MPIGDGQRVSDRELAHVVAFVEARLPRDGGDRDRSSVRCRRAARHRRLGARAGTAFAAPMTLMTPYAQEMTDTELDAMFAFLQSLPPTPTGE